MTDPTNPIPYRLRDSTSKPFDVEEVRKKWLLKCACTTRYTCLFHEARANQMINVIKCACDEIERLREENAKLREAMRTVGIECAVFHHSKEDRHESFVNCPVAERFRAALGGAPSGGEGGDGS